MPNDEARQRSRLIIFGVVGAYLLLLVGLASVGRFTFVTKTAVVPVVLLAVLATGHVRAFVEQWAVFLSLLVLFDAFRGYIYYSIVALDLDVYMGYVIELERWLLGGHIAPVWVQARWWDPDVETAFDQLLTVVHGSHFLFFLLFSLTVWHARRAAFPDLKLGMLLVMAGGLVGYLLVPTVPPWMAASEFGVLPEITRVYGQVYNTATPTLRQALDTNPIAAMPSLHTAFPAFLTLVAWRLWRWRALPIFPYFALMLFSLVYGGEHYVADELAGIALAGVVYTAVYPGRLGARLRAALARQDAEASAVLRWLDTPLRRHLAATALVLLAAEVVGQISLSGRSAWSPGRRFVARELAGKSPLAPVVLGRIALAEEDLPTAQREFERALTLVQDPVRLRAVRVMTAQTAMHNGDAAAAVRALVVEPLDQLDPEHGVLLARGHFATEQRDAGMRVLTQLSRGYPGSARLAYERGKWGLAVGALSPADIEGVVLSLRDRFHDPVAAELADRLAAQLARTGPARAGRHRTGP
ncbi:MAG: phosphatase PAP2 family protein [Myxococcales bacterium FL481]|nr:MAG: phosphatase PAP2 family protein [Myxococcales bacterium FL481]